MAKRSKSDNNRTLVTILTFIFLILAVLIAEQLGIDVLNEEDGDTTISSTSENDTDTSNTDETSNNTDTTTTGSNTGSVITIPTSGTIDNHVSTSPWYALFFTEPLNTNDETFHIGAPVEDTIIQSINNATISIDGALFELELERITQALIDARNRGVQVRLVLDDDHAIFEEDDTGEMVKSETTHTFEDAGWVIYCEDETPSTYDIRCDDRGALMHNKFLIIDGSYVWMGSMNFTHNGVYNNNNNAMFIRSSQLAANYQSEFDEMFLNGIFTRSADADNVPNRQITIRDEQTGDVLIETYFSPEDGDVIENRIVELVNEADTSVILLANLMSLDSIGAAIIQRYDDGIIVQGVFENRSSTASWSQMVPLVCENIPVKQDGNPNTFHHKVIVIDNEIVITGSYNFSDSARDDNSENVLIIHSPQIAQQFTEEFNRRFNDTRAETPTRAEVGCG